MAGTPASAPATVAQVPGVPVAGRRVVAVRPTALPTPDHVLEDTATVIPGGAQGPVPHVEGGQPHAVGHVVPSRPSRQATDGIHGVRRQVPATGRPDTRPAAPVATLRPATPGGLATQDVAAVVPPTRDAAPSTQGGAAWPSEILVPVRRPARRPFPGRRPVGQATRQVATGHGLVVVFTVTLAAARVLP